MFSHVDVTRVFGCSSKSRKKLNIAHVSLGPYADGHDP